MELSLGFLVLSQNSSLEECGFRGIQRCLRRRCLQSAMQQTILEILFGFDTR